MWDGGQAKVVVMVVVVGRWLAPQTKDLSPSQASQKGPVRAGGDLRLGPENVWAENSTAHAGGK